MQFSCLPSAGITGTCPVPYLATMFTQLFQLLGAISYSPECLRVLAWILSCPTLKTVINVKLMALAFTVSAAGLCLEAAHIDRHLNSEFHCCPLGCWAAKYWMY